MSDKIDTGDSVFHRPTGETWIVACVQDGRLSWVGWPEGTASVADCDLTERATPESRLKLLQDMAAMSQPDHRQRYAARRLAAAIITLDETASQCEN